MKAAIDFGPSRGVDRSRGSRMTCDPKKKSGVRTLPDLERQDGRVAVPRADVSGKVAGPFVPCALPVLSLTEKVAGPCALEIVPRGCDGLSAGSGSKRTPDADVDCVLDKMHAAIRK